MKAGLISVLVLAACLGSPESVKVAASSPTHVKLPPPAAQVDYQLGGGYALPRGVRIVSRDRTDLPARGAYNICYLNSFQTQPEETAWWRSHRPEVLLKDHGREVGDPAWPGEVLFDVRTAGKRQTLMSVQGPWIDGCAKSGFLAVEPDNLDSYTRSHGLLSQQDAIGMARLLIGRSHQRSLAVAQKNGAELAPMGHRIGFDFAIAEECQVYQECDSYSSAYGRRVLEVEYNDNGQEAFRTACQVRHGRASIVLRDRNLTRPGDPAYIYKAC